VKDSLIKNFVVDEISTTTNKMLLFRRLYRHYVICFQVRYRIISGDRGGNFTVDAISGEIRPRGTVDFELMDTDANADSRRFNITLRAYDLGEPSLFTDVDVTIFVTDENDYAPVFENPFYLVRNVFKF
jgi:hypothetical protein